MLNTTEIKTKKPRVREVTVRVKPVEVRRKKKSWRTKGHWTTTRAGTRVFIKGHTNRAREKRFHEKAKVEHRETIKYGGHFNEVAEKVTTELKKRPEGSVKPRNATDREILKTKGYNAMLDNMGRETASDVYRDKMARDYEK